MFLGILAVIVTLFLVVGIHEAGHALAAYFFNVTIKRVSIGFGRPLIKWQKKQGIEWVWALWPLGGYVELLNSRQAIVSAKKYPFCFDKKPVYQRIIILFAGVFANLLAAWLALVVVFSIGILQKPAAISQVTLNSLSAKAGFQAGDEIIEIAGQPIQSWREAGMRLIINLGDKNLPITIRNAFGQLSFVHLNMQKWIPGAKDRSLLQSLGITPNLSIKAVKKTSASWDEVFFQATDTLIETLYFFIIMLKHLFTGVLSFSLLLGPLGMLAATVSSFMQGIAVFLFFIATFSLAVALVNIFPIPGLDGGAIVYAIIEKIRGKPLSIALEILLLRFALIVFFILLAQLIANDLYRLG